MNKSLSRRQLLVQAGAAAAGTAWAFAAQTTRTADKPRGANERVGIALIGCGQRGQQLLDLLLRRDDVDLPIACDVDSQRAELAAQRIQQAGRRRPDVVSDFLKALDRKDVDAVIIATPDHWHCIQHLYACVAGKDIYVEAPIAHNVIEGAAMVHATRKKFRVVQVGLQHRSASWFGEAVKQVRAGKLGKVAQTRSWSFARVKPIATQEDEQAPATLDYDRWIGPAAMRQYNAARGNGLFYNWWDYGGGMITRWNVHFQDFIHWAMRANTPISVTAVGGNQGLGDFRETPDTLEVIFEYETLLSPRPGRFMHVYSLRLSNGHAAWGPPVPVHNGSLDAETTIHSGVQFHGDEATLFADQRGSVVFPVTGKQDKVIDTPVKDNANPLFDALTMAHLDDFINSVRTRAEPRAPIEAGQYAAAACHLANISYRLGHRIYYQPGIQRCFSDPQYQTVDVQANDLLRRQTYRGDYKPPHV